MSMRYPGGLLTAATPVNAQYPSGVWTQAQTIPYVQQNVWQRDVYWPYTTLLLHGDGTNGAQNNTFLDSSTNNFTITRNGNTTQGSFTPFQQDGYWSNYFDGTGDYLQATDASAFDLSNFDWCFECWAYIQGTGTQTLLSLTDTGAGAGSNAVLNIQYVGSTSKITWSTGSSSGISNQNITSTNTFSTNQFLHVAAVRDGATITLYVNGANEGTYNVSTGTFNAGRDFLYIGNRRANSGLTDYLTGYLSNVRVVINAPVYTAPFTPSTAPLTAISGTQLLTCQSNRFIDNSSNAFAITVNGNTAVQAFQPFPGFTTWSASVLGGSGYFDGTGDFLSGIGTTSSFNFMHQSNALFTAEGWVYVTNLSSPITLFDNNNSTSSQIGVTSQIYTDRTINLFITYGSTGNNIANITTTGTITLNAWTHIAIVYDQSLASNNGQIYINGVLAGSGNKSGNTPSASNASNAMRIGCYGNGTGQFMNGYISSFRINNSKVYTSAFTPPTAPLTAIANTSLLLNFTNAGIFDNAQMNDLETVGNAQVSTSVVKYGTGSMAFDGTGDWLLDNSLNINYDFGSGDFTIEAWIYPTTSGIQMMFVNLTPTTGSPAATSFSYFFRILSGNKLDFTLYSGSTGYSVTDTTNISTNTWTHVAVTRASGTVRLFRNGTQVATTTANVAINASDATRRMQIGTYNLYGQTDEFQGYIDDLRITKGAARYITNFTPPIARMPNQ